MTFIYITTPPELLIEGLTIITEAARMVADLACRNLLTLNTNKTRVIIVGSSHAVRLFDSLGHPGTCVANGGTIQFVIEIMSLGVILDDTLFLEAPNQSGGKES